MSKATKTRKSAKAQIRETVAEVRAENAKAHEERMDGCAAAAGTILMDGTIAPVEVTKVPAGASGLTKSTKGKGDKPKMLALTSRAKMGKAKKAAAPATLAAPRAPLTQSEAVKAGDAWIAAKEGRADRYGAVEASTPVHNGKVGLTTIYYHDLEVDVATGRVRYIGINPGRPSTPKPDSKKVGEKVRLANTKRVMGKSGIDWGKLPERIDTDKAETMAEMLLTGETTCRMIETETGFGKNDRNKIFGVLTDAGYKLNHRRNPAKVEGDRATANLYHVTAPAAS